ncbi:copia-like retrotransposable element, partial [Apostichopus japonicus]
MEKDGMVFNIDIEDGLYYLQVGEETEQMNLSIDHWHKVMGHCNHKDIIRLKDVVIGMKIEKQSQGEDVSCNVCVEGKFVNTRNRESDKRANSPLELVHTDLCGPINPIAKDGFKYAMSFTDDYSGLVFVYFLRSKSDSVTAFNQFLADCSPIGRVRRLRCDNGGEFTSKEFTSLLREKGIKQEFSSPESPHQNGTAERVQKTPYEAFTGIRPNVGNMHIFGSLCYAYTHDTKKLDPKATQGVFVGYDTKSPAYLVFYPDADKVQRVRLIKIVSKPTSNQETQTPQDLVNEDEVPIRERAAATNIGQSGHSGGAIEGRSEDHYQSSGQNQTELGEVEENQQTPDVQNETDQSKRYPQRKRAPPKYLEDYKTNCEGDDSLFKIGNCDKVPTTYTEAIGSESSVDWKTAMDNEMKALEENDTFKFVKLPDGKNVVGGKWVYTIKDSAQGTKSFKARYVAKGYSQIAGVDYFETFAPTVNMTSVRALMQLAVQQNLTVHQMDVSSAYLNADIDTEIFVRQPEGYEV